MTTINWPAVRAYRRAIAPIYRGHEIAKVADAGFDAGEFSGPEHDALLEAEEHDLRRKIANRFGIRGRQLWYMIVAVEDMEQRRWQAAHAKRELSQYLRS